jgi:hypothetical protein
LLALLIAPAVEAASSSRRSLAAAATATGKHSSKSKGKTGPPGKDVHRCES